MLHLHLLLFLSQVTGIANYPMHFRDLRERNNRGAGLHVYMGWMRGEKKNEERRKR
jgi:hypothetical protein